jgi:serine/threonine protein kinase
MLHRPQSLSELPTAMEPLTAEGTILGTLQYMAPEQLEGKEADARTGLFAFGAVLYEMATGKRAFEAKSQASLIAKILASDPPTRRREMPGEGSGRAVAERERSDERAEVDCRGRRSPGRRSSRQPVSSRTSLLGGRRGPRRSD